MIVVNFYEAVPDNDNPGGFHGLSLWEVRVNPIPNTSTRYPDAVPLSELEARLARWIKHDHGELQGTYTNFPQREIRSVPFERMWQQVNFHYWQGSGLGEFAAPTEAEAEAALSSGEKFGYRNVRDLRSALVQLRAIEVYMQAVAESYPSPNERVAQALGVTLVRARNLIQFAREGALLSPSQAGRPGGQPTARAFELAEAVREVATKGRKGKR